MTPMGTFDPIAALNRIREQSRARPKPELTPGEVRARRMRERDDRLLRAGYRAAEDRRIVVRAIDKPPIIQDHVGNRLAYRELWRWRQDASLVAVTLWGPTGTGKSLAAAWTIADMERAYWLQADDADILDWKRWDAIRERAIAAPVCVINDLGDEEDRHSRRLASVVRRRIDDGKRTIVTTNLPLWRSDVPHGGDPSSCIQARYDDRVADRLGRGRVIVAQCGGESLRGRAA